MTHSKSMYLDTMPCVACNARHTCFQAHYFLDFVAYCCHLFPCVVDVRLFDEVN